ncbi:hypothetical protein [Roseateles violae]|uniref:DUF4148 domain-containing protein n=1 Tax=Roseateles violae TaxID=3058042 RepID=A0ABT8DYI8_9BURK|nr:hypothetical protein [Pelomonas sp. PFR6]MDN3922642.1 hypothetical protein [Pelomonas sp. PFR6]
MNKPSTPSLLLVPALLALAACAQTSPGTIAYASDEYAPEALLQADPSSAGAMPLTREDVTREMLRARAAGEMDWVNH